MTKVATIPDLNDFDGAQFAHKHSITVDQFWVSGGDQLNYPDALPDPGSLVWTDYALAGTLSHDQGGGPITVAGSSVAVLLTDSRGASASGKTVNLTWTGLGMLPIDKNTDTLDGSGQSTFTLGPCAAGNCTPEGGILLTWSIDGEPNKATLQVKFEN